MSKHEFGGDWTNDKLERVRKYLCAYTTLFKGNLRARYFKKIFVDAFAGTGQRSAKPVSPSSQEVFESLDNSDVEAFKAGSARIALEVEPPFDRYVFVEQNVARSRDLYELATQYPQRCVQVENAEANAFLRDWCRHTNWQEHRAVVFLDPYGMQVEWKTLVAIAETQAIDLWVLFPHGVAVNRLLPRNSPPPATWDQPLTRIFGTEDWKASFYTRQEQQTLFGDETVERRNATQHDVGTFFVERLKSIFAKVADNPLTLLNSKQTPIYLLCFAAGNPRGAPTAVKIAKYILGG